MLIHSRKSVQKIGIQIINTIFYSRASINDNATNDNNDINDYVYYDDKSDNDNDDIDSTNDNDAENYKCGNGKFRRRLLA